MSYKAEERSATKSRDMQEQMSSDEKTGDPRLQDKIEIHWAANQEEETTVVAIWEVQACMRMYGIQQSSWDLKLEAIKYELPVWFRCPERHGLNKPRPYKPINALENEDVSPPSSQSLQGSFD